MRSGQSPALSRCVAVRYKVAKSMRDGCTGIVGLIYSPEGTSRAFTDAQLIGIQSALTDLKGNGTLITPTLTSVGTIAPGAGVGNLAITGDAVVGDSGVAAIEVVNDTFNVLAIHGELNLASFPDKLNTETLTGFSGKRCRISVRRGSPRSVG